MMDLNTLTFELNGETIVIDFNKPHWSDSYDNCDPEFNQKEINYKNDLID